MPRYEVPDSEIKSRLQSRALDVARRLIPDSHAIYERSSGHYKPRNPSRNDKNPGSFVIFTKGDNAGSYKDFATGESGDIIALIGIALGFDGSTREGYPKALQWAAQYLGIARGEAKAGHKRIDAPTKPAYQPRAAADPKKLKGQWLGGAAKAVSDRSDLLGTPLETYLCGRQIDLKAILASAKYPYALGALRFHPQGRYYRGSLDNYSVYPMLCSAFTKGSDFTALHKTFIAADGKSKAPESPARKMRGDVKGASIKLWRGASGMSEKAAAANEVQDTLITVEGVEKGLAAIEVWPDYRVRVAGSVGNFSALDWPSCAHRMVLIGDNDAGDEAAAQWEGILRDYAHSSQGRELVALKPPKSLHGKPIKDLDDWLSSLKGQF